MGYINGPLTYYSLESLALDHACGYDMVELPMPSPVFMMEREEDYDTTLGELEQTRKQHPFFLLSTLDYSKIVKKGVKVIFPSGNCAYIIHRRRNNP